MSHEPVAEEQASKDECVIPSVNGDYYDIVGDEEVKAPDIQALDEEEDPLWEAEEPLEEEEEEEEEVVLGPCPATACPFPAEGWAGLATMVTCANCRGR